MKAKVIVIFVHASQNVYAGHSPVIFLLAFDCFCCHLQQVFYWGGGKQTPHKVDMFQGGHSALQVTACHMLALANGHVSIQSCYIFPVGMHMTIYFLHFWYEGNG